MEMNKSNFILWLMLPALLPSCTNESFVDNSPVKKENETTIRVTLQMPAAAPKTYAISAIDENYVETVDVLSFEQVTPDAEHPSGWSFTYSAKGTAITDVQDNNPNKAKKQFDITLIKNPQAQCLVMLANVRTQLAKMEEEGMAKGADKDALLKRLVYANPGSWNANNDNSKAEGDAGRFMPFPMWGETTQKVDDAITQIGSVTMLREIARLDVVLGNDVVTAGNFLLDEIYVYNSKNKGQVVPATANLENPPVRVKNATVPEGSINNSAPLVYPVPSTMKTAFERTVYLFEAKAVPQDKSSEATCVVVGGTYGTDTKTSYYRLDFFQTDGKTYRDLLRNFLYRINIISVSGSGYPTPEDAFNSKPLNMTAEIKMWDDAGMGNVIFDGQYVLAVNQALFTVPREADEYAKLSINSDYPGGWKANVTEGGAWLSIDPTGPTPTGTSTLPFRVTANTGTGSREGIIQITAGRLFYDVRVIQTDKPGLEIKTSTNILEFPNYNIQEQFLTIDWEPSTKPCELLYSSGYGGVYLETIVPPVISGGHHKLGVKPKRMTADELKNNSFLKKESKLNIKATSDKGVTEIKEVTIRQENFTVVPIIENFYQMDGKQRTFKIISNAIWKVEAVEDPQGVILIESGDTPLRLATQKGPGEHTFTIRLKDDMTMPGGGKIGSAKVKYRISSTQGMFSDVTFEINAVSAFIFRAADVPKNGEEGGLDQDLLVHLKDLPVKTDWFGYNNRSSSSKFSHVDPPGAPQDSPVNPKSCAALTTGGFNDWRMPTMREQLAIFTYIRSTGSNFSSYYFVASTSTLDDYLYSTSTQDGEASGNYCMSIRPLNSTHRHGLTTYTDYSLKTDKLNARCVRTLK